MFKKVFKGFTLIELLVVIAIIAILAAILFPVFAQAREKARASSCLSNTKQLATALILYADDYDETMPGVDAWDAGGTAPAGYMQTNTTANPWWKLYPYYKNINMLCCPSAPNRKEILTIWNYPSSLTNGSGGDYPCTGSSYTINGLANNYTPLSIVAQPSSLIYCCEQNKERAWTAPGSYPSTTFIMPTPNTLGSPSTSFSNCGILAKWNKQEPHNGGQNCVFCDGHAKYAKTGTLTFRNQGITPPSGYNYDDPMPHNSDDYQNYLIMQNGQSFAPKYE